MNETTQRGNSSDARSLSCLRRRALSCLGGRSVRVRGFGRRRCCVFVRRALPRARRRPPSERPGRAALRSVRPSRLNVRRRRMRRACTASRASTSCGIASTGGKRLRCGEARFGRIERTPRSFHDAAGLAALCDQPFSRRQSRLWPRRDDRAGRGGIYHPRGAASSHRHARSVSRRKAHARRTPKARCARSKPASRRASPPPTS